MCNFNLNLIYKTRFCVDIYDDNYLGCFSYGYDHTNDRIRSRQELEEREFYGICDINGIGNRIILKNVRCNNLVNVILICDTGKEYEFTCYQETLFFNDKNKYVPIKSLLGKKILLFNNYYYRVKHISDIFESDALNVIAFKDIITYLNGFKVKIPSYNNMVLDKVETILNDCILNNKEQSIRLEIPNLLDDMKLLSKVYNLNND